MEPSKVQARRGGAAVVHACPIMILVAVVSSCGANNPRLIALLVYSVR